VRTAQLKNRSRWRFRDQEAAGVDSQVASGVQIGYTVSMLVPAQHRFTVANYYRMAETGVLKPDARVELVDGRIIVQKSGY
jgi:hypothetical protein